MTGWLVCFGLDLFLSGWSGSFPSDLDIPMGVLIEFNREAPSFAYILIIWNLII